MAHKEGKIPLSHDIDEESFNTFEKICKELGPPKLRVIEIMIETFAELPIEIQHALKSYNKTDRKLCFDLIRKLSLPPRQAKFDKEA